MRPPCTCMQVTQAAAHVALAAYLRAFTAAAAADLAVSVLRITAEIAEEQRQWLRQQHIDWRDEWRNIHLSDMPPPPPPELELDRKLALEERISSPTVIHRNLPLSRSRAVSSPVSLETMGMMRINGRAWDERSTTSSDSIKSWPMRTK